MAVIYEVTVKAGTYEKDGQTFNKYQKIGNMIETKKGQMIKLDSIPLVDGGWNGWCYLFTPLTDEEKEAKRNAYSSKKQSTSFDDVEF
jgi:hypothetical protein